MNGSQQFTTRIWEPANRRKITEKIKKKDLISTDTTNEIQFIDIGMYFRVNEVQTVD